MSSQGDALRAKADKKAASSPGLFGFGSQSAKWEEVHDLYTTAANTYRMDKLWKESGDCFTRAAESALKNNEKDEAANDYWAAGKSYKKSNPELAVYALQQTIQIYKERGRYRQAADREKEIAGIFHHDLGDFKSAMDSYEQAGDLYSSEDATATATGCYKEAADLAATLEQYPKAVQLFENVAEASLRSPLTKYNVKNYFFKAALCWLASGDVVSAQRAVEKYSSQDVSFPATREAQLLNQILESCSNSDEEAFTAAVAEYDRITKLDNWTTAILLHIKKGIDEEPGLV